MNTKKILTNLITLSILLTGCNYANSNTAPTASEPTEVIEQVENPPKETNTPSVSSSIQPNNNNTTPNKKPVQNKPVQTTPSQKKPTQNKPTQPKPSTPTHQHTWKQEYTLVHHVAKYRTEPVYEQQDVYEDQPIYKYKAYWTCNECKKRYNSIYDIKDHVLYECGGGYTAHEERYQVGTEKVYKGKEMVQVGTKQVLEKEAWDEKVPNGESCICGARR